MIKKDISLGYTYVFENGEKKYYHRIIAEKMLGRELKYGEVVHHIDGNRDNNSYCNLIVFRTMSDHVRHHANKDIKIVLNSDGSYTTPVIIKLCKFCNSVINGCNNEFCSNSCRNKYRKDEHTKVLSEDGITYDSLLEDIKTMSFTSIGVKYGISDNGVRVRCRKFGLPTTVKEKNEFFKNNC